MYAGPMKVPLDGGLQRLLLACFWRGAMFGENLYGTNTACYIRARTCVKEVRRGRVLQALYLLPYL